MPPGPAPFFRTPLVRIKPAEIRCPFCDRFHIDREEWAHRPHHTHLCEHCDREFEYVGDGLHRYYRGIPPRSVLGRIRNAAHRLEDLTLALITRVTTKR